MRSWIEMRGLGTNNYFYHGRTHRKLPKYTLHFLILLLSSKSPLKILKVISKRVIILKNTGNEYKKYNEYFLMLENLFRPKW